MVISGCSGGTCLFSKVCLLKDLSNYFKSLDNFFSLSYSMLYNRQLCTLDSLDALSLSVIYYNSWVFVSVDPFRTLFSAGHSSLKCFEHHLITSSGKQPVLCRFGPEAVWCRFFLCIPNNLSFYTGVFDVDSWEAPHCWRPLDPLLMISSQAGLTAFMSCITVAFFLLAISCTWCSFAAQWIICFSGETGRMCVVVIKALSKITT